MRPQIFAANWKMHLGPAAAGAFLETFLATYRPGEGREVWFFAPAVSVRTVADAIEGHQALRAGIQNVFWEPKGAFTGEISVAMAAEVGASTVLVGHSERRHVFGETDADTGRKVRAVLEGGLVPLLCVGETLHERERGSTHAVVLRQVDVLRGIPQDQLQRIVVAYEPVWAIGTGRNATPEDAAEVHEVIRGHLHLVGADDRVPVLYGGSVKPGNVRDLMAQPQIDGVLVGGASLDPAGWQALLHAARD